jgi:riboflavin synthase
MFTGIIEEAGEIVAIDDTEGGRRIRIAGSFADELSHGQSIAVSGCCLTVEENDSDSFELFLSQETVERTYLGSVGIGDSVNLERAMSADGRFDGHIAQGHVDTTAQVTRIEQVGDDWTFEFSIPGECSQYIVEKGSIAVDGISLTVADRSDEEFTVAIIPATYELTNLSDKQVGDPVHIEVDVLAKYVERMVADGEISTEEPDVPLP